MDKLSADELDWNYRQGTRLDYRQRIWIELLVRELHWTIGMGSGLACMSIPGIQFMGLVSCFLGNFDGDVLL